MRVPLDPPVGAVLGNLRSGCRIWSRRASIRRRRALRRLPLASKRRLRLQPCTRRLPPGAGFQPQPFDEPPGDASHKVVRVQEENHVNITQRRTSITAIITTAVAVAASGGSGGASTPPPTTAEAVADDDLAAAIQEIIDASMAPGAIDWNCCGVDLPPTGVIVGVRVPGRADIVLAAGTYLDDGTALDPTASFSTASLGHSIVAEIGMKLVAEGTLGPEGTLDPDATIDAWLPDSPNAERVTVGMLIDATHGWADYGDVLGQNIQADLERRWTSGEAAATLQDVAPEAEPGTFVGESFGTPACLPSGTSPNRSPAAASPTSHLHHRPAGRTR
jgi:hypothetical protein